MYKQQRKIENYVQERESKNSGMDSQEVNPHARDQSKKVVTNRAMSLSPESTESSNMKLFLSLQRIHLAQCDIQIFEECFPNQFLQPANKLITLLGKTQKTPNDLRAKIHNQDTSPQCEHMINTLSTTSTKATPIHNNEARSPQMVGCENLPSQKKSHDMEPS